MPEMGISAPSTSADVVAIVPHEGTMVGSMAAGTPSNESMSGSQFPELRFISSVREAFVRSMT